MSILQEGIKETIIKMLKQYLTKKEIEEVIRDLYNREIKNENG